MKKIQKLLSLSALALFLTSCEFDPSKMAFVYPHGHDNTSDSSKAETPSVSSEDSKTGFLTPTKDVSTWQAYSNEQLAKEDPSTKKVVYQFTSESLTLTKGHNYDIIVNLYDDGYFLIGQYGQGSGIYFHYLGYWANQEDSLYCGVSCYVSNYYPDQIAGISYSYNLTKTGSNFDTFSLNLALGFREGGLYVRSTDISGNGKVVYENLDAWTQHISFTPIKVDPVGPEEKTVKATWNTSADSKTLVFYTDNTYEFNFASYNIKEEGTWVLDGTSLKIVQSNNNEIEATLADGIYTLNYVAVVNAQLKNTFTLEAEKLSTKTKLCDWNTSVASKTLTFYSDHTYEFNFASYNIKEEGTWALDDTSLKIVQSNSNEIAATLDGNTYTLNYVAVTSSQLKNTFTLDADKLGVKVKLCDWTTSVASKTLTFYSDHTYEFNFKTYNIKEEGTWALSGTDLKIVQSNANEIQATLADGVYTLNYVAVTSSQLKNMFTLNASSLTA